MTLQYDLKNMGLTYQYCLEQFDICIQLKQKALEIQMQDNSKPSPSTNLHFKANSTQTFIGLNIEFIQNHKFLASAIAQNNKGELEDIVFRFYEN